MEQISTTMVKNKQLTEAQKLENEKLEKLTPRPHGFVPGTMEYQEYFSPGTSSLSVRQLKLTNMKRVF